MDSYGNGTGTIGFLWIPMGQLWKPLDSYGFLRILMAMVRNSLDSYGFPWGSYGNHWIPIDSYGNGKETVGFLWIPMDSYGNGKEIIGFLWIPMGQLWNPLDSCGFLWKWQGNHWIPMDSYGSPALSLSILRHPLYFLSIKSREGEEVWRRGGVPEYPKTLKCLGKQWFRDNGGSGGRGGPSTTMGPPMWPSPFRHFAYQNR